VWKIGLAAPVLELVSESVRREGLAVFGDQKRHVADLRRRDALRERRMQLRRKTAFQSMLAHRLHRNGIRAKLLSDGGPTMWAELMDELREIHLGLKPKRRTGPSVGERLQAAYEKVMAKRAKG
jgi:hypothetical protein